MTLLRSLILLCGIATLSACASTKGGMQQRTQDGVADAAMQPLQDLGLMRDAIPPQLARITDPYAAPAGPGCVWIAYEVDQLTAVLGPDSDTLKPVTGDTWQAQGQDAAVGAAVSAARGAATGWIPARGLVRSFTGAEKSERKYLGAFEAGRLRRAFLKGLGAGQGCKPPAAPVPLNARVVVLETGPTPAVPPR